MSIGNQINKQKKKIKKELISFVKFIVIYAIVVTAIIFFFFEALESTIEYTAENTYTLTGKLEDWEVTKGYGRTYSKVYFIIEGKEYRCLKRSVNECLNELCVGDTVTVTVYNNAKPDWSGRIPIIGFERNGEVYYDIDDANKGKGFVKFCVVPGFVIAEIIAGVVLIVRITMFVYAICKYSSKFKKYKDKQHQY